MPLRSDHPADNLRAFLDPREESAVRFLIWRVLEEVPAALVEAALFGSRARHSSRPDSDIDILLVFEALPPDREPQAGIAEGIAADVARRTGVPVSVWSVSIEDTRPGCRTPMLVDALTDKVSVWSWPQPLPPIDFTPADALYCCDCLQGRVAEGSDEFDDRLRQGDAAGAARRARDDIVRLCTALLLLGGETRPRRAEAIRWAAPRLVTSGHAPRALRYVLEWAIESFGPDGSDEARPVGIPSCGLPDLARVVEHLRRLVRLDVDRLAERVGS